MPALSAKETLRNLKKKGFVEVPGDHHFLEFFHEGRLVLHTKISHGSHKDLDNYLIKQMSVQCKLDKQQFLDLARCPMSKESYLRLLERKGLLR